MNDLPLHNAVSIINWSHYEAIAKKMTIDQLRYSIEDCKNAIEAQRGIQGMPTNSGVKFSGFYEDERHVYVNELNRRRKAK